MNITGRVALIQINVLNDTKVFCDKLYDEYALKTNKGKLMACGKGKFYDVDNMNEITQLNLGINYYFDNSKNSYIKCHEKCITYFFFLLILKILHQTLHLHLNF